MLKTLNSFDTTVSGFVTDANGTLVIRMLYCQLLTHAVMSTRKPFKPALVGVELNPGPKKNRRQNQLRNKPTGNLQLITALGSNADFATQRSDLSDWKMSNSVPTQIPASIRNTIHWFQANVSLNNLPGSTSIDIFQAYTFKLSDLNLASSYSSIFDQYSIVAVTLRFIPTVNSIASTSGNDLGRLLTVIDHDDDGIQTFAQMHDYNSLVVTSAIEGQTRVVYPRVAIAAYSSTFSSFANQRSWIDCGSPNVVHYGIKAMLTTATAITPLLRVDAAYVLAFRDAH